MIMDRDRKRRAISARLSEAWNSATAANSFPPRYRAGGGSRTTTMASTTTAAAAAAAVQDESSPRQPPVVSNFEMVRMPRDSIKQRTLHSWSVHRSLVTNNWVATISRSDHNYPSSNNNNNESNSSNAKMKYIQFTFPCERQARKFCLAYAPPKLANFNCTIDEEQEHSCCRICRTKSSNHHSVALGPDVTTNNNNNNNTAGTVLLRHCRNCGTGICDKCSVRWGSRMLPKTYLTYPPTTTVRVCKSCDWLSNAFCLSLLQGRYQDAIAIHATGNVNLRSSFADIHREAMFPIHCAVMGGSMECVKWLVEKQLCPISVKVHPRRIDKKLSLQTSQGRTLLDLAMTGRPKLDILMYLIQSGGLSIDDVKDPSLAPKTLELIMKSAAGGGIMGAPSLFSGSIREINVIANTDNNDDQNDNAAVDNNNNIGCMTYDESVATLEDACNLCCEQPMDCVLQPCGHQVCCADCGRQLSQCPVCKVPCSVLRIFRQ